MEGHLPVVCVSKSLSLRVRFSPFIFFRRSSQAALIFCGGTHQTSVMSKPHMHMIEACVLHMRREARIRQRGAWCRPRSDVSPLSSFAAILASWWWRSCHHDCWDSRITPRPLRLALGPKATWHRRCLRLVRVRRNSSEKGRTLELKRKRWTTAAALKFGDGGVALDKCPKGQAVAWQSERRWPPTTQKGA